MSKFLHNNDDNKNNAKATVIPQVFSENSRAKNVSFRTMKSSNNLYNHAFIYDEIASVYEKAMPVLLEIFLVPWVNGNLVIFSVRHKIMSCWGAPK